MNTTTETTGIDLLRQTVRARNAAKNAGWIAREIGVSGDALHNFGNGTGSLPTDKLQALTGILFHGHAKFNELLNRLQKTKQEPILPLCTAYPPVAVGVPYVPHSGIGPQLEKPEKVITKPKLPAGWVE